MITLIVELAGGTAAQYDEANRIMGLTRTNVPDGLIFHTACTTENGFFVADTWESQEKLDAFMEKLGPAMQQVGFGGATTRVYPTHNVMGTCKIPE
ncbi:MAG: hypothetical protein H0W86_02945 [Armatimonadetes bacterium]|nr:hypothetical protein [Armatimonadota bacterium]